MKNRKIKFLNACLGLGMVAITTSFTFNQPSTSIVNKESDDSTKIINENSSSIVDLKGSEDLADSYAQTNAGDIPEADLAFIPAPGGEGRILNGFVNHAAPSDLTSYDRLLIPSDVVEINYCAFGYQINNVSITVDFASGSKCEIISGQPFVDCDGITKVTIPSSVKIIGDSAFQCCDGLKEVDWSSASKLESIGSCAFLSCSALSSIDLSNCSSLITIGDNAFNNCTSSDITSINLPRSIQVIGNQAFYECSHLAAIPTLSSMPNLHFISRDSFGKPNDQKFRNINNVYYSMDYKICYGLISSVSIGSKLTFSPSCKIIAGNSFNLVSQDLTAIDLSQCTDLSAVGTNAFLAYNCSYTSLDFSKTKLQYLGNGVFSSCHSLKNITFPESTLKYVGDNIFGFWDWAYQSNKISSNILDCTNIEYLGSNFIYRDLDLKKIDLSKFNKLKAINSHMFDSCPNVTSLVLPKNITSIGECAFYSCYAIKSVDFSNCSMLETINTCAFAQDTDISSLDFSNANKLTYIGQRCFYGETKVSSITFPKNIRTIEQHAFEYCSSLQAINLSQCNKLTTINASAFCLFSSGQTSVVSLPSSLVIFNDAFHYVSGIAEIYLPWTKTQLKDPNFHVAYVSDLPLLASDATVFTPEGTTKEDYINKFVIQDKQAFPSSYLAETVTWNNWVPPSPKPTPSKHSNGLALGLGLGLGLGIPAVGFAGFVGFKVLKKKK